MLEFTVGVGVVGGTGTDISCGGGKDMNPFSPSIGMNPSGGIVDRDRCEADGLGGASYLGIGWIISGEL